MKKCAVIGLGAFGFYLTKSLYEQGHEVLAIDHDKDIVQKVRNFSSRAVVADATDKDSLAALDIALVDFAVVSLGTRIDYSILVTMSLKDLGVKEIFVKAITEEHSKVLTLLGVTEVVFPERDMAYKLATSLSSENLLDHLPLMDGYSIVEIAAPKDFIGKSLKELELRNRYAVQVIAIREIIPERILPNPLADFVIKDSDVMIIMGENDALAKLDP
ncbi:MAG: potassium channel family protein [Nitrospinota bacterium]